MELHSNTSSRFGQIIALFQIIFIIHGAVDCDALRDFDNLVGNGEN
ncbi:MAG: hypothetical protein ABSD50_08065 [Smithella sp.]|jgi:hypothetical protein